MWKDSETWTFRLRENAPDGQFRRAARLALFDGDHGR
jgi:hypothetical protein